MLRHILALGYAALVLGLAWMLLMPGEAWAVAYRLMSALRRGVFS